MTNDSAPSYTQATTDGEPIVVFDVPGEETVAAAIEACFGLGPRQAPATWPDGSARAAAGEVAEAGAGAEAGDDGEEGSPSAAGFLRARRGRPQRARRA